MQCTVCAVIFHVGAGKLHLNSYGYLYSLVDTFHIIQHHTQKVSQACPVTTLISNSELFGSAGQRGGIKYCRKSCCIICSSGLHLFLSFQSPGIFLQKIPVVRYPLTEPPTFILYFFLTPSTLHFYSILFSYFRHLALLFYNFFLTPDTLQFYSIFFFLLPWHFALLFYTFFLTPAALCTFIL